MSRYKLIGILIAVTVFSYFSSLTAPFLWDDFDFITHNIYVQKFDVGHIFTKNTVAGAGLVSNYYRPITSLSFAVDAAIWKQNTFGFHVTNLFLHTAAGIFLFLFLDALGLGLYVAFFVALIFLVHPLQPEAVTYLNSRGDPFYAALLFLSYFLFVKAVKEKALRFHVFAFQVTWSPRILFVLSAVSYLVSLFTKETAIVGFLLFLPLYFLHKGNITFRIPKQILIFCGATFGIALLYFTSRLTFLNFANTLNNYGYANLYSDNLLVRLFGFCKAWVEYITWIIFPINLHFERAFDRDSWNVLSFTSPWFVLAVFSFIVFLSLGWYYYKFKKTFLPLFGFFWMVVFLIPVSGIIPVNGVVYQHWLYVPLVGFTLMVVGVIKPIWSRFLPTKILFGLGMVVAGIFSILTIIQNDIWSDAIGFYQYNLQFTPDSPRLHYNLAGEYTRIGQFQKAAVEYHKSATLVPSASAYASAAFNEMKAGSYEESEKDYDKAIQLDSKDVMLYSGLIQLYARTEQYEKGLPIFKKLEQQLKNNVDFQLGFGRFLWVTGNKIESEKHFSLAQTLSNNNPQVLQAIEKDKE